jgi:Domain of unknown function (DUF4048)
MLALPWGRTRLWSVASATIGFSAGFCVARLLLQPHWRLYAVFLRSALARMLALHSNQNLRAAVLIAEDSPPPKTPQSRILCFDDHGELSSVEEDDGECDCLHEEERDVMTVESPVLRGDLAERRNIVRPISVNTILDSSGPSSPIRPMPAERFGDSPTHSQAPAYFSLNHHESTSPVRGPSQQGLDRSTKRLSLHFPIQPPSTRSSRPPSWHTSPVLDAEFLKSPTEGNFLTLLAAKERRVLELKEELRRAEEDLTRLKNQWSQQEMSKKKQQARRVLPLQPLQTNFSPFDASDEELDEHHVLIQKEMDRRKAILGGVRSSGRKVFSGSRHTRTLSLLSPDKGTLSTPFSATDDPRKKIHGPFQPRAPLERSTTTADMRSGTTNPRNSDIINEITGVPKEAILTAGKQMMGDMKDTFWTFVGDIRQVTVGSEGAQPHPRPLGRSKSHRSTATKDTRLNRANTLITSQPRGHQTHMTYDPTVTDISSTFWREHGILESPHAGLRRSAEANKRRPSASQTSAQATPSKSNSLDDSWDVWGTPTPTPHTQRATNSHVTRRESGSSTSSDPKSTAESSSSSPESPTALLTPRSSAAASDGWPPILAKLAPDGIKTTALGLMADWERAVSGEHKLVAEKEVESGVKTD